MAEFRRRVVHVDLAQTLPDFSATDASTDVRVFWWWRDLLLGHDDLNARGLPPRALAERIAHGVASEVRHRLGPSETGAVTDSAPLSALDQLPPPKRPRASVAVCTRDRPDMLRCCLHSIMRATDVPEEIVVVDNGSSPRTAAVVREFPAVGYVRASRPGLSVARNAAIAATSESVIAFVDDDATVHPAWLRYLAAPLTDRGVMGVTGMVLPADLHDPNAFIFESAYGGLGRGYRRRRFDLDFFSKSAMPPVWHMGAGCNMAIRREAVELLGGFDERLGAGAAGCSEDTELWYRLLARGYTCIYEPWSVVFHQHRHETQALRRQIRSYMDGHVAALFVQFARTRRPGNLGRAWLALPFALARVAALEGLTRAFAATRLAPGAPRRLVGSEASGYLRGLCRVRFALKPPPPRHKAPLGGFLRRNPYPHPLTEGFFYREKMRAIHRVAPDVKVDDVLEIGGGRSGLGRLLYPQASITNVDMDPAHGGAVVNQDPLTSFVVGDATALPFPSESFDAVTLLDVLEHIPDDAAAAAEALRVLRPGGWLLVSSPNLRWRSPYHAFMRAICPSSTQMMARWGHVRVGYDRPALEALFGEPPIASADFITPVTVVGHDVSFSRLPDWLRRPIIIFLAPVTWLGYLTQAHGSEGTETAASWRKCRR